MKLNEVAGEAPTVADAIRKAVAEALAPRGSRLDVIHEIFEDSVQFDVEYDFPENLPKGIEIKKAAGTLISKVVIVKGEMWKEGVYGASFQIELKEQIDTAEGKKLEAELKKQYIK